MEAIQLQADILYIPEPRDQSLKKKKRACFLIRSLQTSYNLTKFLSCLEHHTNTSDKPG